MSANEHRDLGTAELHDDALPKSVRRVWVVNQDAGPNWWSRGQDVPFDSQYNLLAGTCHGQLRALERAHLGDIDAKALAYRVKTRSKVLQHVRCDAGAFEEDPQKQVLAADVFA
jgi:hypothetical protein